MYNVFTEFMYVFKLYSNETEKLNEIYLHDSLSFSKML